MRKWCDENNIDFGVALEKGKGGRTEDTVSMLAPHLDAKKEAKIIEKYEAQLLKSLEPIYGAAQFLEKIPDSMWAIVTSSSSSAVDLKLAASKLPVPNVLVSADCVSKGKPDSEPFDRAIELMGLTPKDCLVFEDADNGVNSALKAGCKIIVIGNNCTIKSPNIIARVQGFNQLELSIDETISIKASST